MKKTPSGGNEQTQSLSGSPSISGATVTLTLAAAVAHNDTGVKVSYTKPASGSNNKLQDAAANEVAGFTDRAVTNNTAAPTTLVAPTGLMAEVDANGVTLSWTAPSDATEIIAYGVYRCVDPCQDSNLAYFDQVPPLGSLGNAPTTYLDIYAFGGATYRYAVKSYYTTDWVESDKTSSITVTVPAADTTAPTLSSATVDGTALVITFNETLAAAADLANSAFTVKKTPSGGNEQAQSLSGSPSISGATVTLTLAAAAVHTDTVVKVSYTKPASGSNNKLQDGAGNEVAGFTDRAVTNNTADPGDTTAPTVSSATVDGTALVITFNETLAAAASLANGAFAVKKTPSGGGQRADGEPERVAVHQRRHGDADPGRGGGARRHGGEGPATPSPGRAATTSCRTRAPTRWPVSPTRR